jgi:hypothetical protein
MKKQVKVEKVVPVITDDELTGKGFSVIFNKEKQIYEMVNIAYDLVSGRAKVVSVEPLGKASEQYQAAHEIKKMLAHDILIPRKESNE